MEKLRTPLQVRVRQASTARLRLHRTRIRRILRWYAVFSRALHRMVLSVGDHDCLNVAQSTAYSAIVALFPALIVAAAVIGLLPDTAPVRFQLADFFDRVLPPSVSALLDATFENAPKHTHSLRALIGAGVVSFAGASNVISTLMEGLRRAYRLPDDCWSFWQRRIRSIELVPLSLVPLTIASLLVVFGHALTGWLVSSIGPQVREPIYVATLLLRWGIALGSSVVLIALLYHLGVPDMSRRELDGEATRMKLATPPKNWRWTILPGALLATALWFPATLIFGWYVTRFTNYSEVYGPLGTGIALLFWLYIISLSVLCGAEFNVHFNAQIEAHFGGDQRNRRR
ncbi:MAG: YihY/virulence factor BrkB family protein [Acidobacteriaceae bacterium]|nr:YihY/virulence factor BrkB family protein [Acidobacteriaceae bacterium]